MVMEPYIWNWFMSNVVTPAVNTVAPAVQQVVNHVVPEPVRQVVKDVVKVATPVVNTVANTVVSTANTVGNAVTTTVNTAVKAVDNTVSKAVSAVNENILKPLDEKVIKKAQEAVSPYVKQALAEINKHVINPLDQMTDQVGWMKSIKEHGETVVNSKYFKYTPWGMAIEGAKTGIAVASNEKSVGDAILDSTVRRVDGITDGIEEVGTAMGIPEGVIDTAIAFTPVLGQAKLASDVVQGRASVGEAALDLTTGKLSKIKKLGKVIDAVGTVQDAVGIVQTADAILRPRGSDAMPLEAGDVIEIQNDQGQLETVIADPVIIYVYDPSLKEFEIHVGKTSAGGEYACGTHPNIARMAAACLQDPNCQAFSVTAEQTPGCLLSSTESLVEDVNGTVYMRMSAATEPVATEEIPADITEPVQETVTTEEIPADTTESIQESEPVAEEATYYLYY